MVDVSDYRAYADHTRIPLGLCLETRNLVFVSQRNRSDVLCKIRKFVFESLVSLGQTSKEINKELVFELCIVLTENWHVNLPVKRSCLPSFVIETVKCPRTNCLHFGSILRDDYLFDRRGQNPKILSLKRAFLLNHSFKNRAPIHIHSVTSFSKWRTQLNVEFKLWSPSFKRRRTNYSVVTMLNRRSRHSKTSLLEHLKTSDIIGKGSLRNCKKEKESPGSNLTHRAEATMMIAWLHE